MGDHIFKDFRLYLGGYSIGTNFNAFTLDLARAGAENTKFDGYLSKTEKPGLRSVLFDAGGFWEPGAGKQDPVLYDQLDLDPDSILTATATTGAAGDYCYFFRPTFGRYSCLSGKPGDMIPFACRAGGRTRCVRGTILDTGIKGTGAGTGRELGAVPAVKSLFAALHVLAIGASVDVVIQSDAADTWLSPTDRITFPQATVIGAQWATPVTGASVHPVDGITDTWWRINVTVAGGNATLVVVMGILPT